MWSLANASEGVVFYPSVSNAMHSLGSVFFVTEKEVSSAKAILSFFALYLAKLILLREPECLLQSADRLGEHDIQTNVVLTSTK